MDFTQLLITILSVAGILLIAVLAVVPTVLDIPAPTRGAPPEVPASPRRPRPDRRHLPA